MFHSSCSQFAADMYLNSCAPMYCPPTFDGTSSWENFICQFERIAQYYGWTEFDMCRHLMVNLDGHAGLYYDSLSLDDKNSYCRLKNALVHRFGETVSSDLAMQQFYSRFRHNGESIREYAWNLQNLIENAMPGQYNDTIMYMLANQFIVGLGDRKCSEYLQLHVDMLRGDAWKNLIEKAEMFELLQDSVPRVTQIVNHVAPMPMHACHTIEVYFANEENLETVCDEAITSLSCLEPEMPSIIETSEHAFISAKVSMVESLEISDSIQGRLSYAHKPVCNHVICDVLSNVPNSSGNCMDCGIRERCPCSAPGHTDTGGRLPQSGTSAASVVNPKFTEVDLVSTCFNREGSSDSCGQSDDANANEHFDADWIDTCAERALQALETFDTVSYVELCDNADLVPMCPAASERVFMCTLWTERIYDSSKFCAEIDPEPPP